MPGLSLAEVFTLETLHFLPNIYRGNTPSAGEDASGTRSNALLHEPRCLSFTKKAKIDSKYFLYSEFRSSFLLD